MFREDSIEPIVLPQPENARRCMDQPQRDPHQQGELEVCLDALAASVAGEFSSRTGMLARQSTSQTTGMARSKASIHRS